jgi:hypothetical protein
MSDLTGTGHRMAPDLKELAVVLGIDGQGG